MLSTVFLGAFAPSLIDDIVTPVQISKVSEPVQPLVLLATGPSAQNYLITKTVHRFLADFQNARESRHSSVFIVSSQAQKLYSYLSRSLPFNDSEKQRASFTLVVRLKKQISGAALWP